MYWHITCSSEDIFDTEFVTVLDQPAVLPSVLSDDNDKESVNKCSWDVSV